MRRGRALRQVARDAGVSLSTVQLWVGRAQHRRLDEVDWADRSSRPRRTSRTPRPLEDLVLQVRQELRDTSDLGEFGAAVIRADLLARDVVGVPSVRTVGRILERRGVLDARRRVRRPRRRGDDTCRRSRTATQSSRASTSSRGSIFVGARTSK
jgi:transposase